MTIRVRLMIVLSILAFRAVAQVDGHYTMFMYNKLYYNPGYAGVKGLASINATYRDQWSELPGAPKNINLAIDAPVGKHTRLFRPVAVGLILNNEQLGVEKSTTIMGNYAYRFAIGNGTLSAGLRGGARLYSANYDQLDIAHKNDPNFQGNVSNMVLPNFGAGAFWSVRDNEQRDKYFIGLSVPMMLQNNYGKNAQNNTVLAKEIRAGYLSGGYILQTGTSSPFTFTPQAIIRFLGNFNYHLPVNCDFNITATYLNRAMLGITYRTDRSVEFIAHLQVLHQLNIGYAYDYSISPLSPYLGQTHELAVGFDIVRTTSKYLNPRFIRSF